MTLDHRRTGEQETELHKSVHVHYSLLPLMCFKFELLMLFDQSLKKTKKQLILKEGATAQ